MNTKFRFIPITDRNTINRWRYLSISIFFILFFCFCNHPKKKSVEYLNKKHQLSFLMDSLDNENIYRTPKEILNRLPKALSIADELQDSISLCQIMLIKAGCFNQLKMMDSTLITTQQGLKLAKNISNDTLLAKAYNLMGHFYSALNDYISANNYYIKALNILEKTKNIKEKAIILNSLGNVYNNIGESKKSIKYFNEALYIFDSVKDEFRAAVLYLNLTLPYIELNDSTNFRKCFKYAYIFFENYKDTLKLSTLLSNQCLFYEKFGKIDSAILAYNLLLNYSKAINNKQLYGQTLYNLGLFYYTSLNNLKLARHFIEKSLFINSEMSNYEIEMKACNILSKIEIKEGNFKKGVDLINKYITIKDSIEKANGNKEIMTIELQKRNQKQEYETKLLYQSLDLKSKQNIILIFSLLIFFLFVGIIILLIHMSYNNLKKMNMLKDIEKKYLKEQMEKNHRINKIEKLRLDIELNAKNKELVSYSLRLITKNDLLNKISKLSEKYYNINTLDRNYYNDLTKIIEESLNMDKEWSQFKVLFEKVHHGFFNRLKQNCPSLTEHELRFCAYIKINLNTKEIARVLNISPNTVRTFKYRLKNKLALDSQMSIESFLRDV